jgi:hypothetical protein
VTDSVLEVLFRMAVTAAKKVKNGRDLLKSQRDGHGSGGIHAERTGIFDEREKLYGDCNGEMGKPGGSDHAEGRSQCNGHCASVPQRHGHHSQRLRPDQLRRTNESSS